MSPGIAVLVALLATLALFSWRSRRGPTGGETRPPIPWPRARARAAAGGAKA